jgi:hypothetical protein
VTCLEKTFSGVSEKNPVLEMRCRKKILKDTLFYLTAW